VRSSIAIIALLVPLACKANAKVSASADAKAEGKVTADADGDEPSSYDESGGWDSAQPAPNAEPKVLASGSSSSGALATLPGFRTTRGGSSQVYVEVIGKVTVKQSKTTGKLVIHLAGVRVPERVNKMDLPTTHFNNTPVGRVVLVQAQDNADLVIELRAPTPSRTRVEQTETSTVVRVDFPRFGGGEQQSAPRPRGQTTSSY
jgi:hypothetical protein